MSERSTCPIALTLDLVGDRWTLLVVRDLVLGKTRFDEFQQSPEGIATNILAARLRRLQDLGLVAAKPDAVDRRRIHYRLTESGRGLQELIRAMAEWGLRHFPTAALPGSARKQLHRAAPPGQTRNARRISKIKTAG
ncbi:MAG TPA: helix-turn-helix domain-containing protein [Dongiaceae bacterium]|jgi:DNA-binding HxlR family transcriptional regulator|nr:helix-turn-helix domain-containing protein [Dongiaceae bacterium]